MASSNPDTDVDIIVAGAGLVGAAAALALARCGFTVALIDRRRPRTFRGALGYDVRTVALNPASATLLADIGVWDALTVCNYDRVVVWEETGSGQLDFRATQAGVDSLGAITEVSPAAETLWQSAAATPDIDCIEDELLDVETDEPVRGRARTGAAKVTAVLADRRIRAHLLVAADGAGSTVRTLLSVAAQKRITPHTAIATVVETERPHGATAYQRFLADGPVALLPLPDRTGQHYCSVVWSQPEAEAERRIRLDDAAFLAELEVATESRLGGLRAVDRRFAFKVDQQLAETFHPLPGTLLIGDAAHVLHPLAGQGVNLGFEDVSELVAVARGLDAAVLGGPRLWQPYARRRRLRARLMLRAMDTFRTAYALNDPVLHWLRNRTVDLIDHSPRAKSRLIAEALGIG